MMKNKALKFILFFIVPIAIFILWLGGFLSHRVEPGTAKEEKRVISGLSTLQITPEQVDEYYKADGMLSAENNAKVATKWMGRVLKINVKEGDYVKKGQILAVLDDSEIRQQEAEAFAGLEELKKAREEALAGKRAALENYEFAKRTYERFKNLYQENAVSKQQLEEIEIKMIAAKSMVDQVNAKLAQIDAKEKQVNAKIGQIKVMKSYATITAPFDGYILKKMNDEGDMVAPGMPIFIIGDKTLQFVANLDESLVDKIKVGDEVEIKIDTLNKVVKGKVIQKNPNIDPMNRSFMVKVEIPYEEGLSSGMYGKMLLPIAKKEKILIPKSAVVKWGQLNAVYVVSKDGTMNLRYIKLGEDYGDKVEVLSGLTSGEVIVKDNVEKACDGCKIGG